MWVLIAVMFFSNGNAEKTEVVLPVSVWHSEDGCERARVRYQTGWDALDKVPGIEGAYICVQVPLERDPDR